MFVNALIEYCVKNIMLSEYRPLRVKATYVRYIWFAKQFHKNDKLLSLFKRLNVKYGSRNNHIISPINWSSLYSGKSNEVELRIQIADKFNKHPTTTTIFRQYRFKTPKSLCELM